MRIIPIRPAALALVGLPMMVTSAACFEFDGYQSGMSLSDVRAITSSHGAGIKLNVQPDGSTIDGVYEVLGGKDGQLTLSFCKDRLFALVWSVPGGMYGAVALGKELSQTYGSASTRFVASPPGFPPHLESITFEWHAQQSDVVRLSIDSRNDETASGSLIYSVPCNE